MKGFFSESVMAQTTRSVSRVPKCGACGLYKLCKSPKLEPTGQGKRKILIIAESPGKEEDAKGEQLVGNSARYLIDALRRVDVDLRRDCWLTSALICHPKDITEFDKKLAYCRPNLFNTIEQLKPEVIIPIGGAAIKSLIGGIWKTDVGEIGRWVGWKIPCQRLNAWICPTYHPAYLLREKDPIPEKYFQHHLSEAAQLQGRPWKKVPDYKSQIELVYEPAMVERVIAEEQEQHEIAAFDYETNMLKPDGPHARIESASICFGGKRTIAFPWHRQVVPAFTDFLRNPIKKIASNLKFEDRWSRAILGCSVKGWWWDTMLAAHVIDNRPNITGLKFQSFVMLGAESYDGSVSGFLRADSGNQPNSIDKIDLDDLLLYNGLDSLLEYKLAMKQRRILNAD